MTVVQSKPVTDASMCATQETKAPWFGKPEGVGICAAVETSAPWLSALGLAAAAAGLPEGVTLPEG